MRSKVLVVGSIVFDIIFAIHGDIKDRIPLKSGKIETINLMFTARNKEVYYGGTAGNIAYGLGLLGEKPLMFSVVGKDFRGEYSKHLENLGVELKVFYPKKGGFTSNFYGISDEKYQQMGIFQPNVYYDYIDEIRLNEVLSEKEFNSVKVAIFSPGTAISTRNHMLEVNKRTEGKATVIFDPGQEVPTSYDDVLLKECLGLADIVIGNEVEIAQIKSIFGFSVNDIFGQGVNYILETMGEKGVRIYLKEDSRVVSKVISAKKVKRVVETTGAGDAFRAGLVYGLVNSKSIEESCKIGTMVGAKSVEEYGGQGYTIEGTKVR